MSDPAYEIQTVDRLIATINQGDDCADATADYRRVMETLAKFVEDYGGKHKAQMVIKIGFVADNKGIDVEVETTTKVPKRPITKERFFLTDRNVLTLRDPARDTMFPNVDLGRAPGRRGE